MTRDIIMRDHTWQIYCHNTSLPYYLQLMWSVSVSSGFCWFSKYSNILDNLCSDRFYVPILFRTNFLAPYSSIRQAMLYLNTISPRHRQHGSGRVNNISTNRTKTLAITIHSYRGGIGGKRTRYHPAAAGPSCYSQESASASSTPPIPVVFLIPFHRRCIYK